MQRTKIFDKILEYMTDPRVFWNKRPSIPTSLNGHDFRSRLEARWSLFFDAIGVLYVYEPRVFDLGWIHYLPDFYIPSIRAYIEIKGKRPTLTEVTKAKRLAKITNRNVYIFWGSIRIPTVAAADGIGDSAYLYTPDGIVFKSQWWTYCKKCKTFAIGHFCDHDPDPYDKRLINAYMHAEGASFKKARRKRR